MQVAYAIGVAHPVSVMVETFGTETGSAAAKIAELVDEHFDLRPGAFREELDLHRPIYQKTAAYGHFGRDDHDFTWEKTDKADGAAPARRPAQRSEPARGSLLERPDGAIRRRSRVGPMPAIAQVEPLTTARALRGPFDYRLPEELRGACVDVGSMLVVPFGRREILGVVVGRRRAQRRSPTRSCSRRCGRSSWACRAELVELAEWIAEQYCSTPARALTLVLPPGATQPPRRAQAPARSQRAAAPRDRRSRRLHPPELNDDQARGACAAARRAGGRTAPSSACCTASPDRARPRSTCAPRPLRSRPRAGGSCSCPRSRSRRRSSRASSTASATPSRCCTPS